jgi:hypothetical protein
MDLAMTVVRTQGETWYVEAVYFPSGLMAKTAWERCDQKLVLGPGEDGASVWRLSPHVDPDQPMLPTGIPEGVPHHVVVFVSQDRRVLAKARRLLRDGTPFEPVPEFCETMIARRRRMMVGHHAYALQAQPGGGSQRIRRAEGQGAHVYLDGQVREPGRG